MKRGTLFFISLLLLVTPVLTYAQSSDERRGWGYLFVAPGGFANGDTSATLHLGGGGERLVMGGFGIAGELGYLGRTRDFGSGSGVASVNVAYHFGRSKSLVPFVTGGGSLAFRSRGASGGGNVGVGVQYWIRERIALRLEVRDHIFSSDSPHAIGFRIGLAFR